MYVCGYVCVHECPRRPEKGMRSLELELGWLCTTCWVCWELNLGLLEKQSVLLTMAPPLQPQKYPFETESMIYYCVSELLTLHTNHSPVDMLAKVGFWFFGDIVFILWLDLTRSLLCSPGWPLSRRPLASASVG